MNFFSVSIYCILAFLLIYKLQYSCGENEEELFYRFNGLRGLFAVEIVIGHVIRYESSWLYPLGKFMLISVSFFLFVSGWGLCRSFHRDKNYLTHFLTVKCGYLLAMSIYAFALRYIIWIATGNSDAKENILLQYFQKTNWYIWELIFFYLVFYLVYKLAPNRMRILLITVITGMGVMVLFWTGAIQGYYMSAFAFPAGLFFYEYFDAVLSFLKRGVGKLIVLAAAVLGLLGSMLGMDSLAAMVYCRNLLCLAALCIMIYFLAYFRPGNIFLKFLGKYSAGIYIYQFMFLAIDEILRLDWPVRMVLILGCTLLTAVVMQPVHTWTRKKLVKREI